MNPFEFKEKLNGICEYKELHSLQDKKAYEVPPQNDKSFIVTTYVPKKCPECDDTFEGEESIRYKLNKTKNGSQWCGFCKRCKNHFVK